MIFKSDLEKFLEDENCQFKQNEKGQIILKETGKIYCKNFDELLKKFNRVNHSDLTVFYSDALSMQVIWSCNECNSYIFVPDDDYDPQFKCPHCSKENKFGYKYWTLDEIFEDKEKLDTLYALEDMMKKEEKDSKREERTGLKSWELWKKEKKDKSGTVIKTTILERLSRTGLKGLHLHIIEKRKNDEGKIEINEKRIPLSLYARKIFKKENNN